MSGRAPLVTLALVAVALLASLAPGLAGVLEYDRRAVEEGQIWRLLTAQLVHWTPQMALADLGVLLAVGAWLENRCRRLLASSLAVAAVLVAVTVHLLARDLLGYRGSSGLATAVFTAAALVLVQERPGPGLLALLLLGAKSCAEMGHGAGLAAGLPAWVRVASGVHVAGALAAVGAFSMRLWCGRRRVAR